MKRTWVDHTWGVPKNSKGTGSRGKCSTCTHTPSQDPKSGHTGHRRDGCLHHEQDKSWFWSITEKFREGICCQVSSIDPKHLPFHSDQPLKYKPSSVYNFSCKQLITSVTVYSTNKANFLLNLIYLKTNFVHPWQTEMTSEYSQLPTMYNGLEMQISSSLVISIV